MSDSVLRDGYNLGRGVSRSAEHETGMPSFIGLQTSSDAVSGVKELDEIFDNTQESKYTWVEECPVSGSFQIQEMWKRGETETFILSFDRENDLTTYSEILNKSAQEDPSLLILDEQKQFCQDMENWKVLIITTKILYKKIIW